jgi:glycyl-tRNA synthetase beta chain
LRKASFDGSTEIDAKLFDFDEEKALFEELERIGSAVDPLLASGDYGAALHRLAELKGPVDRFFDEVMVMDENPERRRNRLGLLARLKSQFDRIADLSVLG